MSLTLPGQSTLQRLSATYGTDPSPLFKLKTTHNVFDQKLIILPAFFRIDGKHQRIERLVADKIIICQAGFGLAAREGLDLDRVEAGHLDLLGHESLGILPDILKPV